MTTIVPGFEVDYKRTRIGKWRVTVIRRFIFDGIPMRIPNLYYYRNLTTMPAVWRAAATQVA